MVKKAVCVPSVHCFYPKGFSLRRDFILLWNGLYTFLPRRNFFPPSEPERDSRLFCFSTAFAVSANILSARAMKGFCYSSVARVHNGEQIAQVNCGGKRLHFRAGARAAMQFIFKTVAIVGLFSLHNSFLYFQYFASITMPVRDSYCLGFYCKSRMTCC